NGGVAALAAVGAVRLARAPAAGAAVTAIGLDGEGVGAKLAVLAENRIGAVCAISRMRAVGAPGAPGAVDSRNRHDVISPKAARNGVRTLTRSGSLIMRQFSARGISTRRAQRIATEGKIITRTMRYAINHVSRI